MMDSRWHTLAEISAGANAPEASLSAQLRFLRQPEFGSHQVLKRRRGGQSRGQWEYKVIVNKGE